MNPKPFTEDPKDRKRRFLRGLNYLLGQDYRSLEDDIPMNLALHGSPPELRNKLANNYGLEYTPTEIVKMLDSNITTVEFTEQAVRVIYQDRGAVDLNALMSSSMKRVGNGVALDLREMDSMLKYGMNGGEWCDVAEGPCSCGAWH